MRNIMLNYQTQSKLNQYINYKYKLISNAHNFNEFRQHLRIKRI